MELKEIWEQEAKNYHATAIRDRSLYLRDCNSFLAGCKFEHNRSHWFDPEMVLPGRNEDSYKFDRSILVLVKDEFGNVASGYRSISSGKWYYNADSFGKVISWTYIPN